MKQSLTIRLPDKLRADLRAISMREKVPWSPEVLGSSAGVSLLKAGFAQQGAGRNSTR